MATLVRRTWANIRDEVIASAGGQDYTGFSARVEQIVYSTYLELSLAWHHYEMETVSTPTVATSDTTIPVPTDCFILMGVYRPSSNTNLGNMLDLKRTHFLTARFNGTAAQPTEYCRFGTTIVLNCPTSATYAGTWGLRYYKIPAAPDYTVSASPATAWLWDEAIIESSLAKLMGRVWRPDLGAMGLQSMQSWLSQQIQPDLQTQVIAELPDLPTASRPVGGSQG